MKLLYKLRVWIGNIMWWFLNASYEYNQTPFQKAIDAMYEVSITGGGTGFNMTKDCKPYQPGDTVTVKINGGEATILPDAPSTTTG